MYFEIKVSGQRIVVKSEKALNIALVALTKDGYKAAVTARNDLYEAAERGRIAAESENGRRLI